MPDPKLIGSLPGSRTRAADRTGHLRPLPPDLLRDASRRLSILALVVAALWCLGFVLYHVALREMDPQHRWHFPLGSDSFVLAGLFASVALWVYARGQERDPRTVFDVGLAYMVFTALLIGLMLHWDRGAHVPIAPTISWLGAVVLVFAAIVPSTPLKTAIASVIAVSMNPVGMLIARAHGTWDFGHASNVLLMHYPDLLLVGVAGVISHVVTQLGRQVTRAREMGSYRLGELLGSGGMGEVYKATHTMLARPAAVKLIRPEALGGSDSESAQLAMRRFTREAEAAAKLRSPHTVEVYDFGVTEDQRLYFVMEMLDGLDLETLVRRHGALPAGRVIHILRQVCESLEEAHVNGLVHRDIKPANIQLGCVGLRHDFVKVLDFGLVKEVKRPSNDDTLVTAKGIALGTPSYMAPELALGEEVDARADIYALGCVAYFLLTGGLVFEADNAMRMMVKHVEQKPAPPSTRTDLPIPRSLDDAVLGCLAKEPAARTASAALMAEALERARADTEPWTESDAARWWAAQTQS